MSNLNFFREMEIMDNIWGKIKIPSNFVKILYQPSVQALKYKRQLGMTARNPSFTGGYHSRYDHAIGVYYVATKLIKACKERFSSYFTINKMEENAFYLSALLHDLGHKVGSHAFERISKTCHEDETYKAIYDMEEIIDDIFGVGTCDYVVDILNEKNRIKREVTQKQSDKIDLLFVLSELMVGAVDIDRIDYIARDYLNIYGEKKDFSVLFDYMELELVNNRPKIIFNVSALDIVEDYLMTRFRLYNNVHFHPHVIIQDEYFKMAILSSLLNSDEIGVLFTETQLNYIISTSQNNYLQHRCIEVLDYGDFSQICYKKFNSKEQADIFFLKLSNLISTENQNYCGYVERKVTVYDKKKNCILLKSGDEINDITALSNFIKDRIYQETLCIYVDLKLLKVFLHNELKDAQYIENILYKVTKLFKQSDKEIEYKFIVSANNRNEVISKLTQEYSNIANTIIEKVNQDVYYYVPGQFEPQDGSVRIRYVDKKIKPTIKFTLEDETSITKRDEHNFFDISENDFLILADKILESKGYNVDLKKNSTIINVNTMRRLYNIKFKNSIIELALDKSIYNLPQTPRKCFDTMIEVELKFGETLDLWSFVNELKDFLGNDNITTCTESKLSRAIRMLKK